MALIIWRFTDGKPGHDSQSIGLCVAIEKLKSCERFDISIDSAIDAIINFLLNRFPKGKNLPDPDIIIGAGHGTHLAMLAARHVRNGKIIVLMKPSLPLMLFDICLIPEHDDPPARKNVITTIGALNPVQFNKNKQENTGLILLGGTSRHYHWDNTAIINQIDQIIASDPETKWAIADSPRTPKETLKALAKLKAQNIDLLNYGDTDTDKLRSFIFNTKIIWVSIDSISMIYEALSSGATVGLLESCADHETRVVKAIKSLVAKNLLTTFSSWKNSRSLNPNKSGLNEADRCALLLSERGVLI